MVTKRVTTKKKTGRPPSPPEDLRSERTAMRMHPDLLKELNVATREAGLNRSLFIEAILIAQCNARIAARGGRLLDAIGKYLSDEEMERVASDAAAAAHYASFAAPPVLHRSPVGGLPRWKPTAPTLPTPLHRKK
jgi:hypothetical protein